MQEARLIEIPYTDLHPTIRALSDGGMDAALARAVRQSDGGKRAVRAMRAELLGSNGNQAVLQTDRKLELIHGLWTPPAEQIEQVRRWNNLFGWGFKSEAFTALEQTAPTLSERLLDAVTIEICLPRGAGMNPIQRTFEELWRITAMRQDRHSRWNELRSDRKHLKLLDGIEHKPGIKWVRDDMGANWEKSVGMYPQDVRGPRVSPHASILSAAALHPGWVQSMDGINVPYVWISGYMVTLDGNSAWSHVPLLGFDRDGHGVDLDASAADLSYRFYAVPSRRES